MLSKIKTYKQRQNIQKKLISPKKLEELLKKIKIEIQDKEQETYKSKPLP